MKPVDALSSLLQQWVVKPRRNPIFKDKVFEKIRAVARSRARNDKRTSANAHRQTR